MSNNFQQQSIIEFSICTVEQINFFIFSFTIQDPDMLGSSIVSLQPLGLSVVILATTNEKNDYIYTHTQNLSSVFV